MEKYFTNELSVLEMDKRILIVWFWKRLTKIFGKLIQFEEAVFGGATRLCRLIGTWAAIKGIESLTLLCENEADAARTMERYRLELDILKGNFAQLKGDF